MDTPQKPTEKSGVGPAIGLFIILAVIVLGGIYFWNNREQNDSENMIEDTQMNNVEDIQTQSSSDEIDAIESDLNNYNEEDIDQVDSDLNQ